MNWEELRTLVLEYNAMGATNPGRPLLRSRIAKALAGAVWSSASDGNTHLLKGDLLTKLVSEEIRRHGSPVIKQQPASAMANGFLEANALKAKDRATFLTAVVGGFRNDGDGGLEGYVRRLVQHYLHDVSQALQRAADPKRAARNPELRAALIGGIRPLNETDWPVDSTGNLLDFADEFSEGDRSLVAALDAFRSALDPIDQAVLDLLLQDSDLQQKEIAALNRVSEATVAYRKRAMAERLKKFL